ncbi:MAG: SRPBCC family protein [Hyphomicrobium sp.]|nr:SRPBCC family protein [Hyphomicrobium sp.]
MVQKRETSDARLDLVLTRNLEVPRALMWKAWTEPKHLKKWFTPVPWVTTECMIELRPGGEFRTVMRGPDGQINDNAGCYLEITEGHRLVWTTALVGGYRPAANPFMLMTAIVTFDDHAIGTTYTARVLHNDEASRQKHADMGFAQGWGAALDQLVAAASTFND